MTFESDYKFMEKLTKVFRLDTNATNLQRTGSIVADTTNPEQDQLCANMISEVVKVAEERVKSKQRTASITSTSKIDEVGLLKSFMKAYK
jgi:hypothetical protein